MFARPGRWLARLVPLLLVALPASAMVPLAEVLEVEGDGQLVVVEDHRFPIVWMRIAHPIGSRSQWWHDNAMEVLWPLLVS